MRAKGQTELPECFACPTPLSMRPIFVGRRRVTSGRLANRFKSRFGTNTKLLRGVIGPISKLKVHLNTASLRGSCRNNALPRSPREKLQLVRCLILSMGVKSLSLQERNMLFIDRLNK